jgi:dipeptidyl aminopeptidase/acylaminoacyl peptidase
VIRLLGVTALLLLFLASALGAYFGLASLKGRPVASQAAQSGTRGTALPGTMYVAQQGRLYSFHAGVFKQLTPAGGWTQPALSPDRSRLVAVKREFNYSDLYLLGLDGKVQAQLTHNQSGTVELNHWAFYPRFSPDGQTVFYSYDPKDPTNTFRVDLAVYALTVAAPARPRAWTVPNHYTGGDTVPIPLSSGALLYTKYSIDEKGIVHSQVWIQGRSLSIGAGLTAAADDCSQAGIAPDGVHIAMVCSRDTQGGTLEWAQLNLTTLSLGAALTLVSGQEVSSPAVAPDGQSVVYYAPARPGGPLQLWTVPISKTPPSTASPSAAPGSGGTPIQVTHNLAFDSTGAPAWGP